MEKEIKNNRFLDITSFLEIDFDTVLYKKFR